MRMTLKGVVVYLLLRLQFPPFRTVLRAFYGLAIRACVWRLRRVPGLEAVYLAGSLTGDDVLWGISDIDFIVFMSGRESDRVRIGIERRFSALRRLFPVLGADRKAVYFLDEFPTRHAEFPILQHLFDPRFHRYRLLHGRDVIAELGLPPLSDAARSLSILWKLKYWTEKILLIVCSQRLTRVQKTYSFFKAMDDVARLGRVAAGDVAEESERGRSLERAAALLDSRPAAAVERLLRERREKFRRRRTDLDELLEVFRTLVARAAGTDPAVPRPELAPPTGDLEGDDRGAAVLAALRKMLGTDCRLRRFDVPAVTASVTDCDGLDRPTYLLVTDRDLRIEEIRRLKRYQEEALSDTATLFVRAAEPLIHAVSSEMMEHWLYLPRTEEHLWRALAAPPGQGGPRPEQMSPEYTRQLEEKLARNMGQIRRIFDDDETDLIHTTMHAKLVFTALQRLILAREMQRGDYLLPGSSEEILAYLEERTPVAPAFLGAVRSEYRHALAGTGNGLNAYFGKLHELVRTFLRVVEDREPIERLAAVNELPDRTSLTISTVIITRNRSAYLERCLEAVLRVRRRPDEILVVDNGSTDATRDVVERMGAQREIRYIPEPTPGVSHARNTGSRAARGDILAFIDDDAVPTPDWLENIENAFLKSPAIGIVGGAIHHFRNERDDAVTTYYRLQEGQEPC